MKLPRSLFQMHSDLAKILGVNKDLDTACKVLLITGQNACGKSMLRRVIEMNIDFFYPDIELIQISHQLRSY